MKDQLVTFTLITNVNSEFSKPKLCYNYICQICEEQNSEEVPLGVVAYQTRAICSDCAKEVRKLIKSK